MQPRYFFVVVLSLCMIAVSTVSVNIQHRCWEKDPIESNTCLDTQTKSHTSSVVAYRLNRRDESETSASQLVPSETSSVGAEVSATTSPEVTRISEVDVFSSTESLFQTKTDYSMSITPTTQSTLSERALFTPVNPNQVENSTPADSKQDEHSTNETKKLMGLPLAGGIGVIVAIILLVVIITGSLVYLYFKRRRASRWPKSNKDLLGYIDLHDVPATPRKAHPSPLLSADDEANSNPLHPSMHPAVISARAHARVNSQLSFDPQPEMSEGNSTTAHNARSGYPKPTIYRLSVSPMLASQQELGIASGSTPAETPKPQSLPDYSFVMSAILPYESQQEGEINVNVGDELAITDEMGPDWLIGFNLTTKSVTGGFPRTCVTGSSY